MIKHFRPKGLFDETFEGAVILKGLHGLLELAGGFALLFTSQAVISRIVGALTRGELSEDPHDFVANTVVHASYNLTGDAGHFAVLYLLIHGVINLGLAVSLLLNKLWAYPALIVSLVIFIGYQLERYSHTHSVWLLLLSIFDIVLVWLAWREYRKQKALAAQN